MTDPDFEWAKETSHILEILKQIGAGEKMSVDEVVYINPNLTNAKVGQLMLDLYNKGFIDAETVSEDELPEYLPHNYYYLTKKGEMTLKKANIWGDMKEYRQKLDDLACIDYIAAIRAEKP